VQDDTDVVISKRSGKQRTRKNDVYELCYDDWQVEGEIPSRSYRIIHLVEFLSNMNMPEVKKKQKKAKPKKKRSKKTVVEVESEPEIELKPEEPNIPERNYSTQFVFTNEGVLIVTVADQQGDWEAVFYLAPMPEEEQEAEDTEQRQETKQETKQIEEYEADTTDVLTKAYEAIIKANEVLKEDQARLKQS
jgi:hypothetical protein